jgi:predicted ATPase
MFSLVSGVYDSYFAPTQLNLLVVGASGTGKTALLERLKVTQFTKNKKQSPQQAQHQQQPQQVPSTLLPLSLRQHHQVLRQSPVISSRNDATIKTKKKPKASKQQQQQQQQATSKRRNFLSCPAPSRYQKKHESSDEEEEDEEADNIDLNASETTIDVMMPLPDKLGPMGRNSSQDIAMEDVSLRDSEHANLTEPSNHTTMSSPEQDDNDEEDDDGDVDEEQQHDLLGNKAMLPLHKIRPTST